MLDCRSWRRVGPTQIPLVSENECAQLRRDKLAPEARLRRIPEERERGRFAIEQRQNGLVDQVFPVSVMLLVPEYLATRSPCDRRRA